MIYNKNKNPRWPKKESKKNFSIYKKIHQLTVQLVQSKTINSIGKPLLLALMTVHIQEESSFWTFTSQLIILSDHQKLTSLQKSIIQISTQTDQSVWTFWKINGHQLWPFQKSCCQFHHCWLTPTQMILWSLKLLNFTKQTSQNSKPLPDNGPKNMLNEVI